MAQCDRLEAQLRERDTRQADLARAALARFTEAPTPANLDLLFHPSFTLQPSDLRKTILTLAVQGKLVPQNPEDEPAEALLNGVAESIMEQSSGKPPKHLKQTRSVELARLPHPIPESWKWCRFGSLVCDFRYGTSRKCDRNISGTPVLRIPNLRNGRIDPGDLKFTKMPASEFSTLRLNAGDLLLVRSNGSENLVGRSAVVSISDEEFAYAGYLVRSRLPKDYIDPAFLHLALETPFTREQIEGPIRTTSGVKNVNTTELSNLLVPIPPLAEQRRVVAKVDQLMALVDEWEAGLEQTRATATRLLEALVAELTNEQQSTNPTHPN